MSDIPEWAKEAAIEALNKSTSMAIMRVGSPWEPIARALASTAERVEREMRDRMIETAMRFRQSSWETGLGEDAEYGYEVACKSLEDAAKLMSIKYAKGETN